MRHSAATVPPTSRSPWWVSHARFPAVRSTPRRSGGAGRSSCSWIRGPCATPRSSGGTLARGVLVLGGGGGVSFVWETGRRAPPPVWGGGAAGGFFFFGGGGGKGGRGGKTPPPA